MIENKYTKDEIRLLIKLEEIRVKKIELSSKCRLKELGIRKEIALIYRSKKHVKKIEKAEKKLKEGVGE